MHRSIPFVLGIAALLVLAGCAQGPGHTRAAGTIAGTGAGALLGAAVSPCNRGGGALVGATLGLIAGSMAGDSIACDQERYGCPPCGGCGAFGDCCPEPVYVEPCPPPCPQPCAPPRRYYRGAPPSGNPAPGWYYVPPPQGAVYYGP
jgi:hypothetical protein